MAFKDGELTLTTKHGATFEGKRNADGTEIVGESTKQGRSLRGLEVIAGEEVAVAGESTKRGRTLPLTLTRSDPSTVVAAPPIPVFCRRPDLGYTAAHTDERTVDVETALHKIGLIQAAVGSDRAKIDAVTTGQRVDHDSSQG